MRKAFCGATTVALGTLGILATIDPVFAQELSRGAGAVEVSDAVAHAVSTPVMDMKLYRASGLAQKRVIPVRPIPLVAGPEQPDPVVQVDLGPYVSTTTPVGFAGVGDGDYGFVPSAAPPDTNMAVGATQIVQWVNSSFAVFDKTTDALIKGPVAGNTLFTSLGGACAANNDGDIIAQYDKVAKRWVLTQFSVSTTPYLQCVAVSTTSDATGSYHLYAFSYGNTQFPDYPKLGVWPDAYYISFNIFAGGSSFSGAKVCAYNRGAMLKGLPAKQVCFQLSPNFGGLLPADLDSASNPPVAGTPEPFINFGRNSLNVWRFLVNWKTPTSSTLSKPIKVRVAPFTAACGGGGTCISQPGVSQKLDSLADRVMYRFAYRPKTLASASEVAVVNHSVKGPTAASGVRWYQLSHLTSGTPAVVQQGTVSPDANSRWMGSIAMDKAGNIALGYSKSGSTVHPSIYYTGRLATDPAGIMQTEGLLKAGGGSQNGGLNRWGDYSAMMVDPSDDCTFYYTTEYLKATGSFNWSTWISSFKFPGC